MNFLEEQTNKYCNGDYYVLITEKIKTEKEIEQYMKENHYTMVIDTFPTMEKVL